MDVEKITNYLCDKSSISSEEIQEIENCRCSDSESNSSYDELEAAILMSDAAIYEKCNEAQNAVWSRLESKIEKKERGGYIEIKRLYRYTAAAAAVVLILFGVGLSLLLNRSNESFMMSIEAAEVGSTTAQLFDGTSVTLNSNSTLKYSNEFNLNNRDVILSGEAWFDVVKSKKPFVVYSKNVAITALGTSFNVRSNNNFTEVTLNSGKVIVTNAITNDSLTTLRPGQKAIIDSNLNVIVEECNALSEGIWRENVLEFKGKSLDEIIKTLEKWHGIAIVNNVKPNGKTYWMKMTEKRITTTLEVFKNLENIDYEIVGDTIVLSNCR